MMNPIESLLSVVRNAADPLVFNVLEIGARPVGGPPEPFHKLIQAFPGSCINAFEVDPALCEQLNDKAPDGVKYHAVALGRRDEDREFFMTRHPMCGSLYKSNERYIERYNNMEVAMLAGTETLTTKSLDSFASIYEMPPVDFIKIDIQGAELDVFQGGAGTLENVVAIVTEVEFVPLYKDQPLFGQVDEFLSRAGFAFHKFLNLGGRALKPFVYENNPNFASQHMWADAVYVRDLLKLDACTSEQLIKLAVLVALYGSLDMSVYCLREYDRREQGTLCLQLRQAMLS